MTIYSITAFKDLPKKPVLFVYRAKGATCHPATLRDKINGYSEIRIVKTKFGRTEHKTYSYPGIPHYGFIPGAILVDVKDAPRLKEIFKRFKVSHVKIEVKSIEFKRWSSRVPA